MYACPGSRRCSDVRAGYGHTKSGKRRAEFSFNTMASRTYPLRQPPGHKPPVPRWQLVFPESISSVFTAYIGVQGDETSQIADWVAQCGCQSSERFVHIEGDDVPGASIWVCYWTDAAQGKARLAMLDLSAIHASLSPAAQKATGLWCESFGTPTDRVETNYTGLDYLPGLARLPDTAAEPHTLTAYWGAARDRIPASAHDAFPESEGAFTHERGSNRDNVVHIRSGQFWESCPPVEAAAYQDVLEPTMLNGLRYLWDTREASTAAGLRYIRNVDDAETQRKETCSIGFFASLERLESWAAKHPSHVAIYTGAIRHAKRFGEARKFRTWHEVSVLKEGEASFEYINCAPGTGVLSPR